MFNMIHIRSYEVGLKFRDGEFVGLLSAGKHLVWTRLGKVRVRIVSKRDPWIVDEQLDVIVKSGKLAGKAEVIDLKDHQRALVWIDGRFDSCRRAVEFPSAVRGHVALACATTHGQDGTLRSTRTP